MISNFLNLNTTTEHNLKTSFAQNYTLYNLFLIKYDEDDVFKEFMARVDRQNSGRSNANNPIRGAEPLSADCSRKNSRELRLKNGQGKNFR